MTKGKYGVILIIVVIVITLLISYNYLNASTKIYLRLKSKVTTTRDFTPLVDTLNIDRSLSDEYIQDSTGEYFFRNTRMPLVDSQTFEYIGFGFAKDKNNVYQESSIVENLDSNTVRAFSKYYILDRNGVRTTNTPSVIFSPDSINFLPIDCKGLPIGKDTKNTYYSGTLLSVDSSTLRCSQYGFLADKNNVYFETKIVPFLNSAKTVLIDDLAYDDTSIAIMGLEYGQIVKVPVEFDMKTFSKQGLMLKDSTKVYYNDSHFNNLKDKYIKIDSADAPTFKYLGICGSVEKSSAGYYSDKSNVYIDNKVSKAIDAKTFVYYGTYENQEGMTYSVSYARDKNNIYVGCGSILAGADKKTFLDLTYGYAKDKGSVWYLGNIVKGAYVDSFVNLDYGFAKDNFQAYIEGIYIPNIDTETLKILTGPPNVDGYKIISLVDKNGTYQLEEIYQRIQERSQQ